MLDPHPIGARIVQRGTVDSARYDRVGMQLQGKLSNDPLFEEKLADVIGLYLNPPDNAMVFTR